MYLYSNLIWHVGLHHCGSTYFQREIFEKNTNKLENFIKYEDRKTLLTSFLAPVDSAQFLQFKESLHKLSETTDKPIVISSEGLSGFDPLLDQLPFEAEGIIARIARHFPGSKIMLVYREPAELAVSTYRKYIKFGGAVLPRAYFDQKSVSYSNNLLRREFRRLEVFDYRTLEAIYKEYFDVQELLFVSLSEVSKSNSKAREAVENFIGVSSLNWSDVVRNKNSIESSIIPIVFSNYIFSPSSVSLFGFLNLFLSESQSFKLYRLSSFPAFALSKLVSFILPASINRKLLLKERGWISKHFNKNYNDRS